MIALTIGLITAVSTFIFFHLARFILTHTNLYPPAIFGLVTGMLLFITTELFIYLI